jgi:uroporphyrinogen decarboxylase
MDHRTRVLCSIEHQEPDRVPTALWGSTYGLTDPVYHALLKHLGLGDAVAPFRIRRGHSVNYYDDRILEALDIDVRHAWLGFTDIAGPPYGGGIDAWGIEWAQAGLYLSPSMSPLTEATIKVLEDYPWPDVERLIRREELGERARYLRERTDYAVIGRAVDSYGPFERASQLRGYENFMMDLAKEEEFADVLIGKVTDVLCRLIEIYMATAGPYLDLFELPGDDYAAQSPSFLPACLTAFSHQPGSG